MSKARLVSIDYPRTDFGYDEYLGLEKFIIGMSSFGVPKVIAPRYDPSGLHTESEGPIILDRKTRYILDGRHRYLIARKAGDKAIWVKEV